MRPEGRVLRPGWGGLLQGREHLLAAKVFTRAKEMGRAAEAYESAGMFHEASRMYLLVRNYAKAVELFQKVPNLHPQFREASDNLARTLWEKKEPDPAPQKAEIAIQVMDPQEETLPLRYQLAQLHLERVPSVRRGIF